MRKISLVLVFMLLISCLTPLTFAQGVISFDYQAQFDKSAGVDSQDCGAYTVAQIEGAEFVIFPFEISESGVYEVFVTAKNNNGGKIKAHITPENIIPISLPASDGNINQAESFDDYSIGTYTLSKGKHTLRITGDGGVNFIKSISFDKKEDKESYRLYAPSVLLGGAFPPGGATYSGTYAWCWEFGTDFVGGTTLNFNMNVEKSGKYDLYMCAGSDGADYSIKINGNEVVSDNWQSANHSVFKKELVKNVVLTEGNTTVNITCLGSDAKVLYLNHLDFVLESSELEIKKVSAMGKEFEETVPVNADVFTVEFADAVNPSDVTAENISILSGDEQLPAALSVTGNTVKIALKKSLVKGKTYTLSVNNVKDKDGILSVNETEFIFTASEQAENNAILTLDESSIQDGVVTAKGNVKSSENINICGRNVYLYAKGKTQAVLSEAETDEFGAYSLSYTIGEDASAGMLDFVVKTEYSDTEKEFSVLYVTEKAEKDFLEGLKAETTAEGTKALIEANEAILSIDVSEDIKDISEEGVKTLFDGLKGREASSVSDVRNAYIKRLAMMKLSECEKNDEAENLLANEEILSILEINADLLSDISSYKESYLNDLINLETQNDENVYIHNVNYILNSYALLKNDKENTEISAENKTAYLTQKCEIELSLVKKISDVKKITLCIEANDEILSSLSFKNADAVVDMALKDGEAVIEITPQNTEVSTVGILSLVSQTSGEKNVNISGKVVYDLPLSYELSSELYEKNLLINVLDELPPETTTAFSENLITAEGVDTLEADGEKVGFIEGSEYIIFPVELEKSGLYEIYVTAKGYGTDSRLFAQTSREKQTGTAISQIGEFEKYLLRTEYLSKGKHNVKVVGAGGQNAIMSVTALRVEEKENYRRYAKSELDMNPQGVSVSGTYAAYYEDGTDMVGGTQTNFDINVENGGFYDLYMTVASAQGANVAAQINGTKTINTYVKTPQHIELTKMHLGTVALSEGKQTVSIICLGPDSDIVMINSIDLILKSTALEVEKVMADDIDLLNGDALLSTDAVSVVFNADIKTDLSTDNFKLMQNGKEIPFEISAQKNTVTFALTEALINDKEVKLVMKNITDESGAIKLSEKEISFNVSDKFVANGETVVKDSSMKNENLTVTGIIKSSKGTGISGRKVYLYKDGEIVNTVISAQGGKYELTYTMPEGSMAGMHSFEVKGEYSKNICTVSEIYVTKEQENIFLTELSKTETVNDVEKLLKDNEDKLSVNVEDDLSKVSENGKIIILEGLVSSGLNSISDVRDKYYSRLSMVKMSETDDLNSALELLADEETAEYLGINIQKLADISDNHEEFAEKVMELTAKADEEDYKNEVSEILEGFLLTKYEKQNSDIVAYDKNIYVGQVAVFEIESENVLTEVKEITLTFENVTENALECAKYIAPNGMTAEITKFKNGFAVKLSVINGTVKELGTLEFSENATGNYEFKISGTVAYNKELAYVLTSLLGEKKMSLSVSEKPSGGASSAGGGGGGGSSLSGNLGQAQIPEVNEKFEFTDLSTCEWAKDSIKYLLARGIISESDNKEFRPQDSVKREEFVKMIVASLGIYDASAETTLKDVKKDAWYYTYIANAEKVGLVCGNDLKNFGTGENITREDIAVIVTRALELVGFNSGEVNTDKFTDDAYISDYAKNSVYYMKKLGIVNGVGDNSFAPKMSATRAQTAKIIYEMLKAVGK